MAPLLAHPSPAGMPGLLPALALLGKATLLLLLALAGAAALRRASAGARHTLWTATLVTLVLLPALSHWVPWRIAILPSGMAAVQEPSRGSATFDTRADAGAPAAAPVPKANEMAARRANTTASSAGDPRRQPSTRSSGIAPAPETASARRGRAFDLADVWLALLGVWGLGVVVCLARLAVGMEAVRRIVRDARGLDTPNWTKPLWEVADRLDLADAPRLVCGERVTMPFACGIVHPTVVLPGGAEDWSDERRRAVLFHELAHVRRRDLLGHLLGRIVCAVYWFHPLVWAAARHMRAESERACDDLVLVSGTRASEYADHLLQIVTSVRSAGAPAVALAMARRKEFEGRMLAILDPGLRRTAPGRLQSAALVLALAGLAVSVSAMAPASHRSTGAEISRTAAHGAAADTGEHTTVSTDHAVGEAVRSAVSSVASTRVTEAVRSTVDQAVERTMDATPGDLVVDGRALTDVTDARTMDDMRDAVRRSVEANLGHATPRTPTHADSAATALLVQVLRSDSAAAVRRAAAWALAQRGDRAAVAPLAAALQHDRSAEVREMAAWGLARSGDRAAIQALGDAVQRDADARVRSTAAWALGQIADPATTPALDGAMADPAAAVRFRAAWALGSIEPRHAPPGLVKALGDTDGQVRLAAAWALGQIADPRTLPALSTARSTEKDQRIQRAELRAVFLIDGTSDAALRELLKSPDADIRMRATRALAGYGTGGWPWPWPWPMPRPMP